MTSSGSLVLLFSRYTVRSYYNDIEPSEILPNNLTYIDIEQPIGYEAVREDTYRNLNFLRLAIVYDTRPRERENDPNEGIFTDLHLATTGNLLGSDYDYSNLTFAWRQYISLFPNFWEKNDMESIFAYRFLARETFGGTAPFFEAGIIRNTRETIHGIGGIAGVRGYLSNQYVDKFITIANFEYRHTFLRTELLGGMNFQTYLFHDIGRVAPSSKEWQSKNIHTANGFGFSNIWKKNTVISFFMAFPNMIALLHLLYTELFNIIVDLFYYLLG